MMNQFCNTCEMWKPTDEFTKYGNVCKPCKDEWIVNNKQRFYTNREQCICGLYASDGNPKEKHEKTKSHQNYIKYGCRNPNSIGDGLRVLAFRNEFVKYKRLKFLEEKYKQAKEREKEEIEI